MITGQVFFFMHGGMDKSGRYAALVPDMVDNGTQCNLTSKAWKVGPIFSGNPDATVFADKEFSYPQNLYLIPEGGINRQPCVYRPNQPEPSGCGGEK
jgi:hypothetical protein